jgi:chemosensory pili system protein ChpA (sensor histidine kinase/response regulator)
MGGRPSGLTDIGADPLRHELARFLAGGDEVLAFFTPEAAEHVEAMAAAILTLEREGPGEAGVAALFRAVHTLKGAAYLVGCHPVGELAHDLEDLLAAVREGRASLTPAALDVALAVADTLRHMLDPAGAEGIDLTAAVARVRQRLADLLGPLPSAPAPHATARASGMPERWPPSLGVAPDPGDVRPTGRRTIRVPLDRLDALIERVGQLAVACRALEGRLGALDRHRDVLLASRARLGQAATDLQRRQREESRPARHETKDDVEDLARRVAEVASDVTEVQLELAALGRAARADLAQLRGLTDEVRAGLGRARLVSIGGLYSRFVRQGREAARSSGKAVRIETSGEAIELDASVLEHVVDPLLHLVQNAVAHGIESPEERHARGKAATGTVTLSAARRGAFVVVEVADDGRGLDPEHLRRRAVSAGFLSFAQASALTDREALELIFRPGFSTADEVTPTAGRGVGMDVVRTDVGRANGEIEVATAPGVGTRFTLRLPLTGLVTGSGAGARGGAGEQDDTHFRAAGGAGAARRRVLLVDDSISVRTLVGRMLGQAGFEVTTAPDGAEALARLGEASFDVMVTDLEMPRLDGHALLEDVRRHPGTRELPVVILTTHAGDRHRALARRLGVEHYVTKPVAEGTLARLVGSLVEETAMGRRS